MSNGLIRKDKTQGDKALMVKWDLLPNPNSFCEFLNL